MGGGALGKVSIFRGHATEKEWMTFSEGDGGGGVQLNSGIFNDKKVNKQKNFLSYLGNFNKGFSYFKKMDGVKN